MAGEPIDAEAHAGIDAAELGARMAVGFSRGELALLADALGAPTIGGSTAELSRGIVRYAIRSGDVTRLLREVRERKPLLEWPHARDATASAEHREPSKRSRVDDDRDDAPILRDPHAPLDEPEALVPEAKRPRAWKTGAAWLGALMLLATALASGARWVTSTARPARTEGRSPVERAAHALDDSFASVRRACEVAEGANDGAQILALAYAQCGPVPGRAGRIQHSEATSRADTPSTKPASEGPRANGVGPRTPLPAIDADSTCTRSCTSKKRDCETSCGPEPVDASRYGAYQACQGRCLAAASRCRLECSP